MTETAVADQEILALRDRLWAAALDADEAGAVDVVTSAARDGWSPESLLLDVVAGVQRRVGEEWAGNRITVADEHAVTAVNDRAVAALSRRLPRPGGDRPRVTVACVDGEWHALPARLVAETLRWRGRDVDFLGAHVPTAHLISHLHANRPEAVLLSASIPTHLPAAHAALTAIQSIGVPVVVGGAAFGPDGRQARVLHADAWAGDARGAAELLDAGVEPSYASAAARQQIDDLPHLTDQEYTLITRNRPALVKQTLHGLEERYPPMRSYSPDQYDRTAEDIGHVLDFLATALYFDDRDIFQRFVTWTGQILTVRRVPAASLGLALSVLAAQLHEFPRAESFLSEAARSFDTLPDLPASGTGTLA
ncbi:cobalamin B12-binding domain-containing protein [Streptomyces sp. NPDC048002]|uniref:cobalamin B12-binding domain-containing protein n=1 Tax=Streptomyces sp. NPDC048002 TaxID=3154344 RepID=UPI003409FB30